MVSKTTRETTIKLLKKRYTTMLNIQESYSSPSWKSSWDPTADESTILENIISVFQYKG